MEMYHVTVLGGPELVELRQPDSCACGEAYIRVAAEQVPLLCRMMLDTCGIDADSIPASIRTEVTQ